MQKSFCMALRDTLVTSLINCGGEVWTRAAAPPDFFLGDCWLEWGPFAAADMKADQG